MDTEQHLERLADRYRGQGYAVTINPSAAALPPFAQDFKVDLKVDLLAERLDCNVLVAAKADRSEIEHDTQLADFADLIARQRGWRFDLTLLKPPPPPDPALSRPLDAEDLTAEQIKQLFSDAQRLFDSGFEPQAALTAWAGFESAMRHWMRAMGRKAGYGSSPRSLLNELISAGEIDHSQFRDLEALLSLRNVIVHGFAPRRSVVKPSTFRAKSVFRRWRNWKLEPQAIRASAANHSGDNN